MEDITPVESVSLAHIRFLTLAPKKDAADDPLGFEVLLTILISYAEALAEEKAAEKKADENRDFLLKNLPFLLAQSPIAPYLLIAASANAEKLAGYIREPNGPLTRRAIEDAQRICLTMDVTYFIELAISFFGKFAPWCSSIQGYLGAWGAEGREGRMGGEGGEGGPTIN